MVGCESRSTRWPGVRHKAAGKLEPFKDYVRGLLRQAGCCMPTRPPPGPPAKPEGGGEGLSQDAQGDVEVDVRLTALDRASAQSQVRE